MGGWQGEGKDHRRVTRYQFGGFEMDLPSLNMARYNSGCAFYITNNRKVRNSLSPQLELQRGGLSLVQFHRDTVLSSVDPYYTGSKLYAMTTYIMSLWSERDLES